jgi:dolichyl-phosphate-mannose-protein mannosyltransferase
MGLFQEDPLRQRHSNLAARRKWLAGTTPRGYLRKAAAAAVKPMDKVYDRSRWRARGAFAFWGLGQKVRLLLRRDGPLFVVCVGMTALGIGLRVQDLGFPYDLSFDEQHFVLNARNYIAHQHDWNDHPPLGKLLIALGMLVRGDNSLGWRIVPLASGLANVALALTLGRNLFRDRRAGWLAAAFVAGDGFLVAYSRTALLDGILTTFVLATVCMTANDRSSWQRAGGAIAIGCAASIKLTGFALLAPMIGRYMARPGRLVSLSTLLLAPATYAVLFGLGLALSGDPHGPASVWHATAAMVSHHAALTDFRNPLASHWYTWFVPLRPILLRYQALGPNEVRVMTTLGNLVLWWLADVMFLAMTIISIGAFVRLVARKVLPSRRVHSMCLVFAFAVAMLLPWVFGKRDSYIYHYLPSYALLLVLAAAGTSLAYKRYRLATLVLVTVAAMVTVFYAPVWAELRLSPAGFRTRLFLSIWR